MALKVRLSRTGKTHQPTYRIVVVEARSKRNGKTVDILGFYNPQLKPPLLKIDQEKYKKWLTVGAKPSEGLRKILS